MCSCWRVCQGISSALQSKKLLNCIKYLDTAVDCVDTTMFPLQATVFFSKNTAMFNGSVFARGVWSCFPVLDQEEGWRPSINSSSYQWALGRSNQGGFVPLCVSLCRRYHFPLCGALLCRWHLPCSLLLSLILACCHVTVCRDVQCSGNHCSISGTNTSATVTSAPDTVNMYSVHASICAAGTPCNKWSQVLTRHPHNFPMRQENMRRGGVQGLATGLNRSSDKDKRHLKRVWKPFIKGDLNRVRCESGRVVETWIKHNSAVRPEVFWMRAILT